MNTFIALLKREYHEHKGGILWAPVITCAIFLVLTVGGLAVAASHGGGVVNVNGVNLASALATLTDDNAREIGQAIDAVLSAGYFFATIPAFFVALFYLLGALYTDRQDRSVYFWKSMPVSDRATVLSKAATAVVVIPAVAWLVGTLTSVLLLIALLVIASALGANAFELASLGNPLAIVGGSLLLIPLTLLWSLPMVGWTLMCSAMARMRPFLWAIGVPAIAGLLLWWLGVLGVVAKGVAAWYWQHIFARITLGIAPLSWNIGIDGADTDTTNVMAMVTSHSWSVLSSPALWIGAVIGLALLWAASEARKRVIE